ncbi:MAG: 3-isopropylmalate dehydratase small subunit [Aquificaceae bacterium]|nr:3-isopropylmalate dehydratase small subunit [Aquificaceae bacterium]MDW8237302.1 3-isopropylmalate dehydratase small subunit [Aquificaceae bacterium]
MKVRSRVWKFGDNVDTDQIIPARYLNTSDPKELAKHVMEDSQWPNFAAAHQPGEIIVAGKNFGSGSSREHAPIAIKHAMVPVVIAKSFARIFFRNSINIGLAIIEAPQAVDEINHMDEIEVDLQEGLINNITTGKTFSATKFPPELMEILKAGGLMEYARERLSKIAGTDKTGMSEG